MGPTGKRKEEANRQTAPSLEASPGLLCPVCRRPVADELWHRKKFQCPHCGYMPG